MLQARKLKGGSIAFYFRYTNAVGKRERLSIGLDIPLKQARDKAAELSARYQSGSVDLKGVLEEEARASEMLAEAAAIASASAEAKQRATLGALLSAYVGQLRADSKMSSRGVESAFHRHIRSTRPQLWSSPAQDVETDDLVQVLNRIVSAGKRREAAKLRSYLIAAYADAIRSKQDPAMSQDLRNLGITHNPARELATVRDSSHARDRALSATELQRFWQRLQKAKDVAGAVLRFYLLTGGQRVAQLARATVADIDQEESILALRDPKGRRSTPRVHKIPLSELALSELRAMNICHGPHIFTCSHGRSGVSHSYIGSNVKAIAEAMNAAGELPGGIFTTSDLRRTIETRLAGLGVSSDVRAQLQSHGLGGVQNRHYDRHDYLEEKRDALEKLTALMQGKPRPPR